VEGFASSCGDVGVKFLVGLGDGIEETPDVTTSELPVGWLPPFLEDLGNLGGGDGPAVEGAGDQVVGFVVGDPLLFVGVDALIELDEAIT
jgi:hypothetical protein